MSVFLTEEQRKLLLSALRYYIEAMYSEDEIREQAVEQGDADRTVDRRNELLAELKELVYIFK